MSSNLPTKITTETFGSVTVAHTPDELTDETASDYMAAVEQAMDSGHVNIVAQMDQTDAYDSIGLTSLLDLQDELRERGGNLKVCGLIDPGRKIFEVTRLDQRIDLFNSIIDAVASFQ